MYDKLSGRWGHHLSIAIARYAASQCGGGALELVMDLYEPLRDTYCFQLVTLEPPHLVVGCEVSRSPVASLLRRQLLVGAIAAAKEGNVRVTVIDPTSYFQPAKHPLRNGQSSIELAMQVSRSALVPPPLADARRREIRGGPAHYVLREYGGGSSSVYVKEPGWYREEVLQLADDRNGGQVYVLSAPLPGPVRREHSARAALRRAEELGESMGEAHSRIRLGGFGDRYTLRGFAIPPRGSAAQNLVLACSALQVAETYLRTRTERDK